jgi:hypothetical protein
MIVSREPIAVALAALLDSVTFAPLTSGDTYWKQPTGRRLKLWSDVSVQQPACFLSMHAEDDTYTSELTPSKTVITGEIYVYFKTNDATAVPATDLNYILDGIDAALKPSPVTGKQTLGSLVSHCRREGKVLLDPGDIDGQGLALIPIKIFVP